MNLVHSQPALQGSTPPLPLVNLNYIRPTIDWGGRSPLTNSPLILLRCALLDALSTPGLATAPHAPGPCFPIANPRAEDVEIWSTLFFSVILSGDRYPEEGGGENNAPFDIYGLDKLHGMDFMTVEVRTSTWVTADEMVMYSIVGSGTLYDANNQRVKYRCPTAGTVETPHSIVNVQWGILHALKDRDANSSLTWKELVAILRHFVLVRYDSGGDERSMG